jgi:hypothetical protein
MSMTSDCVQERFSSIYHVTRSLIIDMRLYIYLDRPEDSEVFLSAVSI